MKNKKSNFLKLGILLFGISILLWNCENESIEHQNNIIKTVKIEEAINFFKANQPYASKANPFFTPNLDNITQEEINNSNELLTIVPVATIHSEYYSRLLLLKINNNIQSVILNMYPAKNNTNQGFSGEIILTNLNGEFLKGFKVKNGIIIAKYSNSTLANKSLKYNNKPDDEVCEYHSTDDPNCILNMQFTNEIVINATNNTAYISVVDLYELYDDSSGLDNDCGDFGCGNWSFGSGGSSSNNNTPTCTGGKTYDTIDKICKCPKGTDEDSSGNCVAVDPCEEIKNQINPSGADIKPILEELKTKIDLPSEKGWAFMKTSTGYLNREIAVSALDFDNVKPPTGDQIYGAVHTHTDQLHGMFSWSDIHVLFSLYKNTDTSLKNSVVFYLVAQDNISGIINTYGITIDNFETLETKLNNDIIEYIKSDPRITDTSTASINEAVKKINEELGNKYDSSTDLSKTFLEKFKKHGIKLYKANSSLTNFSELKLNTITNKVEETPCE